MIEHHDNPHDALIKALENVDRMKGVLIIYEGKDDLPMGCFDSDLTVAEAIYLVITYQYWLLSRSVENPD